MKNFINISNHTLSVNQLNSLNGYNIIELPQELKTAWGNLTPDNTSDIVRSVLSFVSLIGGDNILHVAGQPAAVFQLLKGATTACVYAHSVRISKECVNADGTTTKTNVFDHQGFHNYNDCSFVI